MKLRLLILLLCPIISAFAEPPKQMAYGPINFGDSLEVANAELKKYTEDMNRRHQPSDGKDVVHRFIFSGTKNPPKLSPKYSKTIVLLGLSKFPVTTVNVLTSRTPAVEYATTVKRDWEVLQDIAVSKFGPQKTNLGFPPEPAAGTKAQKIVTDVWDYDNLDIRLTIDSLRHSDGQLTYAVILSASLKEASPAPAQ